MSPLVKNMIYLVNFVTFISVNCDLLYVSVERQRADEPADLVWLLAYLFVLSAAVSKCTNWIKSNFDVFGQLMTPVVQVDKAISGCVRFTAVDIEKQRVEAREQAE